MMIVKTALFMEILLLAAVTIFRSCSSPRYRDAVNRGDIILIMAIPLIGLFGQNKNVFYLFLFLTPLLWSSDPARLAKRYVLMLASIPELSEIYMLGGAFLGTWSAILSLNAGALAALVMMRRGKLKPVRSIDAAVCFLFLIVLLTVARGVPAGGAARFVVTTFLLMIPPYFIIARGIGSARAAADTVSFIVLGGVSNALIGIFESVKHWALYENFNSALHIKLAGLSANTAVRAGLLRAGGAFVNYEVLGLFASMSLLAAINVRQRFSSIGFYTIVTLLAGALFVSQARSAWIACLFGLLLQAIFNRRWRWLMMLIGGVGGAAALAALTSSNEGMIGQLLGRSGHGESTNQYRQNLLGRGLEEARKHPLTGQTLDQLQVSMNDMRQGDHIIDFVNTHLLVMLVGGIGALLLWLLAWCVPLAAGWRRRRMARRSDVTMIALPFALTGMTFLFLAFTSPVDRILSLTMISMGLMSVGIRLPIEDGEKSMPEAVRSHRVSWLDRPLSR